MLVIYLEDTVYSHIKIYVHKEVLKHIKTVVEKESKNIDN